LKLQATLLCKTIRAVAAETGGIIFPAVRRLLNQWLDLSMKIDTAICYERNTLTN